MRVVVNDKYTYETDLHVKVGSRVICPGRGPIGQQWTGVVTDLESDYDGPCRKILEVIEDFKPGVKYPIETAPKDGRYILLFGDSGYVTTPLRAEVCRWDPEFRPLNPWQNHANDAFTDGGTAPTHWSPLPVDP